MILEDKTVLSPLLLAISIGKHVQKMWGHSPLVFQSFLFCIGKKRGTEGWREEEKEGGRKRKRGWREREEVKEGGKQTQREKDRHIAEAVARFCFLECSHQLPDP